MGDDENFSPYEEILDDRSEATSIYPLPPRECSLMQGFCGHPLCVVCHGVTDVNEVIRQAEESL